MTTIDALALISICIICITALGLYACWRWHKTQLNLRNAVREITILERERNEIRHLYSNLVKYVFDTEKLRHKTLSEAALKGWETRRAEKAEDRG